MFEDLDERRRSLQLGSHKHHVPRRVFTIGDRRARECARSPESKAGPGPGQLVIFLLGLLRSASLTPERRVTFGPPRRGFCSEFALGLNLRGILRSRCDSIPGPSDFRHCIRGSADNVP